MPRWLGLFPLAFFLTRLKINCTNKNPGDSLWVCNMSNLLLAAGLFWNLPALIRIAVLWLFPGSFLWLVDSRAAGERSLSSFLAHFGGLIIGGKALSKVQFSSHAWWHALLFFLGLQQISRACTNPELNVNIAHSIRSEARFLFSSYRGYWLAATVLLVFVLRAGGKSLMRIFPERSHSAG